MIITIPFRTPSVNKLYWNWKGRQIKTKIAKDLEKTIIDLVPKMSIKGRKLRVVMNVVENWYFKNGNVARKDVDNRTKFILDAVFKGLEEDDRYVFSLSINKIQSFTEEKSVIMIEEL